MNNRLIQEKPRQFERLTRDCFDTLVIGGGITGAGIARDLALRGLNVALVDQDDFAFGTSSRSTKLIHGGLRYLEQMAFKLVFESCRERYILQRIAPHLVRPLPLMIPLYRGARRSPFVVRTGLLFYDLLALFRNTHWHRIYNFSETMRHFPVLDPEGLRGAALYWDCQMDDARLCLENVLAARESGAVTVNYAKVVGLLKAHHNISGAIIRDRESGVSVNVQAHVVVNAAGPWLDKVCRFDERFSHKLTPTRGTHILVPRIAHSSAALYLSADEDDRMFFVVPWGNLSLIGTTDIKANDPDKDMVASDEEIRYLLKETRRYLPGLQLTRSHVRSSFAGLRPLLAYDENQPSRASREHAIFESKNGLLSIGGGKYTTYRSMAAEMADRVMDKLGRAGKCLTHRIPLPGGTTGPFLSFCEKFRDELASRYDLDSAMVQSLLERYGSRVPHLLKQLEKSPELAKPLIHGEALTAIEVIYAARYEMARTVEDVLRRRTQLALTSPEHEEALREKIERLLTQNR